MPKKYPGKIYVFYTTRETSASWGSGCSDFTNFSKKILVDVNKISKQDIKNFSPTSKSNRIIGLCALPIMPTMEILA